MKYAVPIHAVIEAANEQEARAAAAKMQTMLQEPMVKMMLLGQGVTLDQARVGTPSRSG